MIKRFLVALIVGLIVMSSQLAAAEDWNVIKHCNTKVELARWIEDGRREGQNVFHFTLANFKVDNQAELTKFGEELINKIALTASGSNLFVNDYGIYGAKFTYIIKNEYPGTHVANAYLSGDKRTAWLNLTAEEKQLYNVAVSIVDGANKRSSEVEKARYIHDEICRIVYDYKDENERNKTAIGALIDHYAHCQGFTDAFYMLGRMCGLNVVRIDGTFKGEPHAWNFITFSDGKAYCVDVTGTFNSKSSMELLTFETMKPRFSCEWEIIPNLQRN